jgi:hypothetical protein
MIIPDNTIFIISFAQNCYIIKARGSYLSRYTVGADKVRKLKSVYGLNITREVESEVTKLCTYATAMENKGIEKGIAKEKERGLMALVQSLKVYVSDFDELYTAVIKNEEYEKVSRETVMKYYGENPSNS